MSASEVNSDLLNSLVAESYAIREKSYRNDAQREEFIKDATLWTQRSKEQLESLAAVDSQHLYFLGLNISDIDMCVLSGDLEAILKKIKEITSIFERAIECNDYFGKVSDPVLKMKNIFIVHGRDEEALVDLELFCRQRTNAEVTVLQNQVNKGETIIEKLLRHFNSETDYCVVLLTPDDLGKGANDPKLMPRARQNVILELGFAMGVIGRNRIAILCDPSIEIPSDILGLGYIEYRRDTKDQSWKFRLYDEFLDAGVLN